MRYTKLANQLKQEINKIQQNIIESDYWDISRFSIHELKIIPYSYQHLLNKEFLLNKKIINCKSKQIGITTWAEIVIIYCAKYNAYPSGILNNTKIGIVSRSNDQAKKVMREIKTLLRERGLWDELVNMSFDVPNTMYMITFKNNCTIQCFPPTESIIGNSLDIVFVDEGAFIEDQNIFLDAIEPTTSKTGGRIIINSTPNGQRGFFFEIFDPFDKQKTHEYKRFWFWWQQVEDKQMRKYIIQKRKISLQDGTYKNFQQTYEALFTVDESSFFESKDVDFGVDESLAFQYTWKQSPCSVGIDYGQTKSATSITVKTKYNNKVITLFQWASFDFDENLLFDDSFEHSFQNLRKRYDLFKIVVDDCIQGNRSNKQLENEGYPVQRYDWGRGISRGDTQHKNRYYYEYRAMLKKGLIKYPKIPEMLYEMKALMEVRMKIITSIEKPKNGTDDRIDSEVMATIPFIEEGGEFESYLVSPTEEIKKTYINPSRYDFEWDRLQATLPDPRNLIRR